MAEENELALQFLGKMRKSRFPTFTGIQNVTFHFLFLLKSSKYSTNVFQFIFYAFPNITYDSVDSVWS